MIINPYIYGIPAAQLGDLFVETFNPQVGSYSNVGAATNTITSGNMAIAGGNGLFGREVLLADVVWNGNNWYAEYEYICTSTSNGQFSTALSISSIHGVGAAKQSCAFGMYFFSGANNALLYIFNDFSLNSANAARKFTQNLTINVGDRIRVRGDFTESLLTVTVTNLTTSGTTSDSLSYPYTLAGASNTYQVKPNTAKLSFLAPQSTVNIKSLKFGTLYLDHVNRAFIGDSITSGYYQGSEANRYAEQYKTATSRTIAIFAGPGDRSVELANATALTYYVRTNPAKALIYCGTNDIANGLSAASVVTNINTIKTALEAAGVEVWVAVPIPRDAVSMTALRTAILAAGYTHTIDWYSTMEDPGNAGKLNPAYSDETVGSRIHPNAAGATVMSNFLIAQGF